MWKFDSLQDFLSKKKNISLLYIIVSICMLLLAFGRCTPKEAVETPPSVATGSESLEKTLRSVLRDVRGVGDVTVAVTFETSAETVPARDRDGDRETVVTLGSGSGERVVAEKEIMPRVRGVVIVADGAGSAAVRKDILLAAMALTGAEAHQIAVFPAK